MAEFFRFLVESNLVTAAFVIGAIAFIVAVIGKFKTIVEPSSVMRLVLGLFGLFLMALSVSAYFLSPQTTPRVEEVPTQRPESATAVSLTSAAVATALRPTATAQRVAQQPVTVKPTTPEEAAALFGGPPAREWKPCPEEPVGCWTFSLLGTSYRVSVPEQCLRADGSIDGWRYGGGYAGDPDNIENSIRIWETLEAATIRCH